MHDIQYYGIEWKQGIWLSKGSTQLEQISCRLQEVHLRGGIPFTPPIISAVGSGPSISIYSGGGGGRWTGGEPEVAISYLD